MDELQLEQFTKALLGLVDLAKTKKNVLQYGEINDAFKGLELTEDKMDLVLEYLEKQKIDIVNAEDGVDNAEDLILDNADIILDMYHLSRNTLRSAADVTDIFIFTCIVCIGCRGIFFIILVFHHRIYSFFTYNIASAVSDGKIIIRYSACKDKFSPVLSFFFKI